MTADSFLRPLVSGLLRKSDMITGAYVALLLLCVSALELPPPTQGMFRTLPQLCMQVFMQLLVSAALVLAFSEEHATLLLPLSLLLLSLATSLLPVYLSLFRFQFACQQA